MFIYPKLHPDVLPDPQLSVMAKRQERALPHLNSVEKRPVLAIQVGQRKTTIIRTVQPHMLTRNARIPQDHHALLTSTQQNRWSRT